MSGALEGLVVLDLARYLSGPHCTLLLARLGRTGLSRMADMAEPLTLEVFSDYV